MGLEEFLSKPTNELVVEEENKLSLKIIELENQIENYKEEQKKLEKDATEFKEKLRNLMISKGCKTWKTPNNFIFTVIEEKPAEEIIEKKFNEKKFEKDYPESYKKFIVEELKMKNGRKGYLRITMPKEK